MRLIIRLYVLYCTCWSFRFWTPLLMSQFPRQRHNKTLVTWDLLMGSKYSNGAKCLPWCALWPCDTTRNWPNVKALMSYCHVLQWAVSVSDVWAGDIERLQQRLKVQLGWTLSYMLFTPILFYSLIQGDGNFPTLEEYPAVKPARTTHRAPGVFQPV